MAEWQPPASDFDQPRPQSGWQPPEADFDRPEKEPKKDFGGAGFLHGLADPFIGGASLATDVVGLHGVSKKINEYEKVREAQYQAARKAAGLRGIDWDRIAGNVINPINIPLGMLGAGKFAAQGVKPAASWLARNVKIPALTGAGASTLQPVEGEDPTKERLKNIVAGGVLGGAAGPIANATAQPGALAINAVKNALGLPAIEKVEKSVRKAHDALIKAAQSDLEAGKHLTAEDMMKRVAKARAKGVPLVVQDIAGPAVQGLGQQAVKSGLKPYLTAHDVLTSRDQRTDSRVMMLIGNQLKRGQSTYDTIEVLKRARVEAARPFYQEAEKLEGLWSPELEQFFRDPDIRRYFAKAIDDQNKGILHGEMPYEPGEMVKVRTNNDGTVEAYVDAPANLRTLDLVKRGMDHFISDHRDITGKMDYMGSRMSKVREAYIAEVDNLVAKTDHPDVYKKARDAWAGPSAAIDAVKWGEKAFEREPSENAGEFAKLSQNDKEFARLGLANLMRDRLSMVGFKAKEIEGILDNPKMRKQMAPFFENDTKYREFVKGVMSEHNMAETFKSSLGGAIPTNAVDQASANQMIANAAAAAAHFAHKSMFWGYLNLARLWSSMGEAGKKKAEPVYEEIAKQLFGARPNIRQFPRVVAPNVAPYAGIAAGTTAPQIRANMPTL